jgi:hypothetical protein
MKTTLIALAGLVAAGFSIPASAQSGCVKQVFNKYCLGGEASQLLSRNSPVRTTKTKDGATQHVFADGAEQTTVTVVQGRIETVARRHHPGVQATFDQVDRDLRRIYGQPQSVPNAKGTSVLRWDQGDWRIILTYSNQQGAVVLTYRHEGLQAARNAAKSGAQNANPRGY